MLMNLIRRVLRQSMDTTAPGAQTQVESLTGEIHREVEVLEPYGMTACPPDDVPEGLAVFIGGEADHGLVIGWLDRVHRRKGLKPGEVVWYSSHGQSLFFDEQGQVTLTDKSGSQIVLASDGSMTLSPSAGRLTVNADVTVNGDVVASGISLQNHVHGGVRSGSSNTTPPQ